MASAAPAQEADEDCLIRAMDRMEIDQIPTPTAQRDALDEASLTAKHLVPSAGEAVVESASGLKTPAPGSGVSEARGCGGESCGLESLREERALAASERDEAKDVQRYVAVSPEAERMEPDGAEGTVASSAASAAFAPQSAGGQKFSGPRGTPQPAGRDKAPSVAVWRRDQATPGRMVSKAIADAFADVPVDPQPKPVTPAVPAASTNARPATASARVGSAVAARGGMPGQSTPSGDAATIASLRQQLAVERRATRRLQEEIDILGTKDKLVEMRGEIEMCNRKLRERDNEIAMLKKELHLSNRRFTEETRVDDSGHSRADKLQLELRVANDMISTQRKEIAEKDARYRKMEAREIKLLSVLPDLYFKLFGGDGGSAPTSTLASATTATATATAASGAPRDAAPADADTIVSAIQNVLATLQRDNERLKAECASLKQECAKVSAELARAKQDNSIILRSLENTKRRHATELKKYKDITRDLEERIILFANDYETLLREYKAEILRNSGEDEDD